MTWLRRARRIVEKNRNEVLGLLLRRYPAWVLGPGEPEEVPAFALHGVQEAGFTALADRLVHDGYRTLTADAYVARARERGEARGRELLLTFDDGHESLYRVAFPILRARGLSATAYVVPGRTVEDPREVPENHASRSLCTWPMLREMHESGVIEVQSHSMWHHSIPVSGRVVDFHRPNGASSFLTGDYDPRPARADEAEATALGTPILDWGARFGAAPAWRDSDGVRRACRALVEERGGPDFFARSGWRRELEAAVREARRADPPAGPESEASRREAIRDDLLASRAEIEARVPGSRVRHFCFPWFRGSPMAVEVSGELGFLSNAWGSLLPSFVHPDSTQPMPIQRLPPRFVWRLPGSRRRPLRQLVPGRAREGDGGA